MDSQVNRALLLPFSTGTELQTGEPSELARLSHIRRGGPSAVHEIAATLPSRQGPPIRTATTFPRSVDTFQAQTNLIANHVANLERLSQEVE